MIKEAIAKLMNKENLSYEEARQVMDEIMDGKVSPTLISSYLTALSMKGETTDEISGSAYAMRAHATKVPHAMDVLEIVGTGGDGAHSINISSTAAIVIAAAGVPVTKHGNVAASSKSGAANVLEALGINVKLEPAKMEQVLQKTGICFLHAQVYHTSMKYVGAIRKELGFRTVFNILGPLTNPAHPTMQVLGVYDEYLLQPMAQVLSSLGVKRGMVVYGQDKLDEVSISAPTSVCEFKDGWYKTYTIQPEDFGLTRGTKQDIEGGEPEYNAQISRAILSGELTGPKRDVVLLNAACGLYVAGKAECIQDGIALAAELIDTGKALEKLEEFVAASNV